jgi:hypothetical protein
MRGGWKIKKREGQCPSDEACICRSNKFLR